MEPLELCVQCNGRVNQDGVTPQVVNACVFFVVCHFLCVCGCSLQHHVIWGGGYMHVIWGGGYMHVIWGGGYMHVIWGGGYMPAQSLCERDGRHQENNTANCSWHIICVVLRIRVHVDVRACALAHIYFRKHSFADKVAHIHNSTKVSALPLADPV
jgi:hypothetical protein